MKKNILLTKNGKSVLQSALVVYEEHQKAQKGKA